MTRARSIAALFAALSASVCAFGACRPQEERVPIDAAPEPNVIETAAAAPLEKPLRRKPKNDLELPTTAAAAYFANLDTQIETMARLAYADLKSSARWRLLASLHRIRAMHRADFDELNVSVEQMGRAIAADATDADAYVDRAESLVALRKLKEARADLERAAQIGGDAEAIASFRAELDWTQGRYEGAREAIEDAARRRPSMRALARVALVRHDVGDFDGSERAFEQAEDLLTDTNPVPIAWLYRERGKHLLAFGHAEEALSFLRDSLRRVPLEAETLSALADAQHALSNDDDAYRVLDDASKKSGDPRVWGDFSRLVRARAREHEADQLKWHAMWRFGELLAHHAEASNANAARFYLDAANDPGKALELFRKDMALGPSSDRWLAVGNALLAMGRANEARDAIEHALPLPPKSAKLYWTAARAYALTGDVDRAKGFAARARAMNPRIEKLEPPMVGENAVAR